MFLVDIRDMSIKEMPTERALAHILPGFRYEHFRGVDRIWTGVFWNGKRRLTFRTHTPYMASAHKKMCDMLEPMLMDFRPNQHRPFVFFTRREGAEHFVNHI